jgi:DNA-binding SARP family transcriptional activator
MTLLSLSLLGPFTATLNDQPLHNLKTTQAQALLVYLAIEKDRLHHRENLMDLLWPVLPRDSAKLNLQQTVDQLHQAIDANDSVPLFAANQQTIGFHPKAELQVDVLAFQEAIQDDPGEAISFYRGDFLAEGSPFENWAKGIRENLRHEALNALARLTEFYLEHDQYADVQTYARRQLEIDPLRESAYHQLMTALANSGQHNAAISLYQLCRGRLDKELGLEPSPETTQLYEQIQADVLRQAKKPSLRTKPSAESVPVFLLTDIEGSTRLWDAHRQAMLPALLKHNQILEKCITQHGGRILELRGDGVKAVFEGLNPLQCMLDIQISLDAADWGEIGDLRIRIGLHGVHTVRKDFDYFIEDDHYYGPVLNYTSRIMDAGHGGQILVSEQVYQRFALPAGASWQDFGRHPCQEPGPTAADLRPTAPRFTLAVFSPTAHR